MEFIFLEPNITYSLNPLLTLIKHKTQNIVGCILTSSSPEIPYEFRTANSALELLNLAKNKEIEMYFNVFLIVKEPETIGLFTVFAVISACNVNCTGTGGAGGETLLQFLTDYNIRTYASELKMEIENESDISLHSETWKEASKKVCLDSFAIVARDWLPLCWGLDAVQF